jgi:hypothetical protein
MMTKQERNKLLQQMIDANEKISPERRDQVFIYSKCLVKLCRFEHKKAYAIWQYERESEHLEGIT